MTLEYLTSEPGADPIIVEGYFVATPARVFRAWTDPNIVMKWFGPKPNSLHSATIDLRRGGAWQFLESKDEEKSVGFEGEYLEIDPGRRLVFTWSKFVERLAGEREATHSSRVEVVFLARDKGTLVRLVHSAVHGDELRRGFAGGWNFAFGTIRALLFNFEDGPRR